MLIVILALLLIGCGDTVENYYAAVPIESTDAATTTPDASPDVAIDTSQPDTSQPDTYAPPDVAVDTWAPDTAQPDTYVADTYVPPVDAGPEPAVCPGGRFTVLDVGTTKCAQPSGESRDGSGQVRDNSTGLIWNRKDAIYFNYSASHGYTKAQAIQYCAYVGKRLPTHAEAAAITSDPINTCAFPCAWATWVSDGSLVVWSNGYEMKKPDGSTDAVLCVK